MAPQTVAKKTTMYSKDEAGRVVVHRFPFDANEAFGMLKAKKLLARGFSFSDPRLPLSSGMPEVKIVEVVNMQKPVVMTDTPSEIDSVEEVKEEQEGNAVITQTATVVCPECGKVCKSQFGLLAHRRVHR